MFSNRHFIISILTGFIITSCNPIKQWNKDCRCNYTGGIGKARFDANKVSFVSMPIEEGIHGIKENYCFIKKGHLQLRGEVIRSVPKDGKIYSTVSNVYILLIEKVANTYFIKDTLDISNKKGEFSFNIKVTDDMTHIIVRNSRDAGYTYDIDKFTLSGKDDER